MTAFVMMFVVLAALLPVAAGVWVAVALIAAIKQVPPSAPSLPRPSDQADDK